MADSPPKKVGSLRDRIAAFENKSTSSTPTSPPAPRPKPAGHVSWKPRPASPSPADEPAQSEKKPSAGAGMSAADAKAAIGAGGSLKERMAALQGHGGFGGAAPPAAQPKPAGEKPKWKPPPQVASPPPDESQPRTSTSTEDRAVSEEHEPKTGHEAEEEQQAVEDKPKDEADEQSGQARELDPEEEERQRRAALAARMARLGGARVGMGPPIFGKKPDVPKKPSAPKAEEPKAEVPEEDTPLSPPIDSLHDTQTPPALPVEVRSPAALSEQEYFAQENKSSTSLLSADLTPTSQPRSPAMPVPAAPRRAAPPRRKAPKSPTPPGAVIADAPVTESPAAGTPQLTSDDSSNELQEAIRKSKEDEVTLSLSPVTQPLQSAHEPPHAESAEHAEDSAKPAEGEEHAEETGPEETRLVQDNLDELAHDNESEHVQAEPTDAHSTHEEPIAEERSPDSEPQQPSAEPEEEEDEAERRKRIAERLKQQGGFNPLGAPPSPPVRRSSEQEPPSRKASVDVHQDESAPEPEQAVGEPEIVTNIVRRQSTDSTAGSLDSPKSPSLPPASTRPDVPTRRDSHMSNLIVHKAGEAEDEDESVDDSSNIPIYNDHPLEEHDEEARVADMHSESEDYVDAPEEQDETLKFAHEESVPVLRDTEPVLQAVVPPRKRVSVPPPPRSAPASPPVAQDEDVYDEFEEVPPTPPRRTSIPPPARAVPPPVVEHVEEVHEGLEETRPPPPKRTSIPPPLRAMPPSPPEVQEAEQPEQPPPPSRRASVPPPHAAVPLPLPPVTYNEDDEDEDSSRVPKSVSAASYDDPEDEKDAPPPPPRRTSIPPPSRNAPPPPSPMHEGAQDRTHEHGSSPPSPVHPRRSIPHPPPVLEYDDGPVQYDRIPTVLHAEPSRHDSSDFAYVDEPEDATIEPPAPPPLTDEEEVAERRKRIAERLRQQGGFNPFGAPPPPPVRKATRPSHDEVPVPGRRASADLPRSPPPPVRRSTRPPEPERRASVETTRSPTSPVLVGQPVEVAHTSPVQLEPVEAEEEEGSEYSAEGNHDAEEDVPPPPPPRRESLPTSSPQHAIRSPSLTLPKREDLEILDEEDGDPIDPSFYRLSRSPSSATLPAGHPTQASENDVSQQPEREQAVEPQQEPEPPVEDDETARKRTIAERMAKLGGMRLGAPPPIVRPPPPPPAPAADEQRPDEFTPAAGGDHEAQPVEDKEEDEFARKQRIAARLASQGGMRFGMFPTPMAPPPASTPKSPPPPSHAEPEESELAPPPLPPSRPPPRAAPPPPVPQMLSEQSDADSEGYSQVDAEESEIEEVYHSDEEAPPPVPARPVHRGSAVPDGYTTPQTPSFRPPVPAARPPIPPPNRPTMSAPTPHNDFVMVEAPDTSEEIPPPPPPRTVSLKKGLPARAAPPPPAPPAAEAILQWDNALDFGGETDLSLSGQWSEDSTQYPAHPSQLPGSSGPVPPPVPAKLTADDLMAQWGRVGVQIHEIATTLYERSKRSLIGDGTFVGFVSTVLNEVPNASKPVPPYTSFGYLIYEQVGSSVHVRANDIMPGDIITLHDAKLKGHKGIQIYHQNVGINEPVCAIIGDYENKKSKVKVFQANQRVGQESVESISYRLEDLKSGTVKIFRVLEA